MKGTLKYIAEDGKFGFIREDGTNKEIFVHSSQFADGTDYKLHDAVEYSLGEYKGKPVAVGVVHIRD